MKFSNSLPKTYRYLVVLLTFSLLLFQPAIGNATIWVPNNLASSPESVGWQIVEELGPRTYESNLYQYTPNGYQLCLEREIAPCSDSAGQYDLWLVMPHCDKENLEWCIESLDIYQQGSKPSKAAFVREIQGNRTPKFADMNFPAGGTISLWKAESSDTAVDGQLFAVSARVIMNKAPGRARVIGDMEIQLMPYREESGISISTGKPYKRATGQDGLNPECAWIEGSTCGAIQDFSTNIRATLSLRVDPKAVNWISARLSSPKVETRTLNKNQVLLIVDAQPTLLPKFYAVEKVDNLTSAMRSTIWPNDKSIGLNAIHSGSMKSFSVIEAWKTVAQEKAIALESTWQFRSLTIDVNDPCYKLGQVNGIVSTNAMVTDGTGFQYGPGSMEYRMSGLHLNPDGSVFKGSYELTMRRDIAECLLGLDNSKISVTITIIEDGKEQEIELTSFKERTFKSVKYLDFLAQGFTFSSPKLRITLNQVGTKKKTISCTNGKLTKKVSAINPKCPAGYKKK